MERIGFWRTSTLMRENMLLFQLHNSQQSLLLRQEQIASGHRIISPSSDPVGAQRVLQYQRSLAASGQYSRNVDDARSRLEVTEGALADLKKLLDQATDIALREANDASATAATRATAATQVSGLISEARALANRRWGDTYLFGGTEVSRAPFQSVGGYVTYVGNGQEAEAGVSAGVSIPYTLSGAPALGAFSRRLGSRTDLNPDIAAATPLADLNQGGGVTAGSLEITRYVGGVASATETIDLSDCRTVQDVLNRINQGTLVTASINGPRTGLTLTGATGTTLTVEEVAGGTTASNLGILQTTQTAGNILAGSDLDPALTLATPLSVVNGGAGIADQTSGIVVTNGTLSATISVTAATTLGDVINAINTSGIYVTAAVADDGNSIEVWSQLSGARVSIAENGGTTALNLGLLVNAAEIYLSQLNSGRGIDTKEGDDLLITQRDGTTIRVDLDAAETVQDVLDLINSDSENTGDLTASYDTATRRFTLVDASAGATPLAVTSPNGSFASANLGLDAAAVGGTLTGNDVATVGADVPGVFTAFLNLKAALEADDGQVIGVVGRRDLGQARELLVAAQGLTGSRLSRLDLAGNRLQDERVSLEKLRGEVQDIDVAEAMVKLTEAQNTYYAGLQAAAQLMQMSLLNFLG